MPASPSSAGSRLVSHRHAAAPCRKDSRHPADRHAGAGERQGVIVTEIDRLHWRIWNGKAKDARITLERIRQVMPSSRHSDRKRDPSSRRLWTALREIDRYLTSQSAWLVNYAERHRAGLRVGTSITEGTANFLVNRGMNMIPADAVVPQGRRSPAPVRCAALNGTLGSSFGQLFDTEADPPHRLGSAGLFSSPPAGCLDRAKRVLMGRDAA